VRFQPYLELVATQAAPALPGTNAIFEFVLGNNGPETGTFTIFSPTIDGYSILAEGADITYSSANLVNMAPFSEW